MNDTAQLTALFDRMCGAWTAGDARGYGACFTADCDYVAFDGTRVQGREQVIESHDKLFRGVLFGSALAGHAASTPGMVRSARPRRTRRRAVSAASCTADHALGPIGPPVPSASKDATARAIHQPGPRCPSL